MKLVKQIEEALEEIRDDPYYDIIPMYYFEGETRENIALTLETTVRTVARNKRRLIDYLKVKLFSDSCIYEIFLSSDDEWRRIFDFKKVLFQSGINYPYII